MKKIYSLFLILCMTSAMAQKLDNAIQFQNYSITPNKVFDGEIVVKPTEIFNGYYYRIIQFENIPNKTKLTELKNAGILLLDYIPNKAYIAAIPANTDSKSLMKHEIRSVIEYPIFAKQSFDVLTKTYPDHVFDKGGNLQLMILCYANVNLQSAFTLLKTEGIDVLKTLPESKIVKLSVPQNKVDQLLSMPFVNYVECIAPTSLPEDLRGRSLHRSNAINTEYGAGRKYNGAGVTIAIADDGTVGPHIDFKGRMIQLAVNGSIASHGDMTSGIAVGAGNLNPDMSGMATAARLVTFDISSYPQIIDALNNYSTYDVTVTSTSYSQGCNNYTLDSKFIDDQLESNRQLIHSFSGGNNASANCTYGGGSGVLGWGNITGGYKVGKNVFAVANVNALDVRDNTSSRGPAPDGRIKPDIAANGAGQNSTNANNTYQVGGGTSAASPGIGGINSQLYQAYRQLNNGANPDATLFKAVLLNTADEIGNPGPDYSFGFGRVNALKAAKALEQNLYLKDSVLQGDSNAHTIVVPANVLKLKVLIHWRDIGGQPSAVKSLVNDINMRLVKPNGSIELPWILNPAANATTLNANATKGNDNLNNVEQITIENPAAGNYTAKIFGATIPFGEQDYYFTYELIKDDITLTYPMGGEGFRPGSTEVLRWDAEGNTGTFNIEYSTNNGLSYTAINNAVAANVRQLSWAIPSGIQVTGQFYIRISRGVAADSNDAPIAMIGVPSGVSISKVCADSTTIIWNVVSGAVAYEVSRLGQFFMDSIATVTANNAKVYALSTDTAWYSVRAITAQGAKGKRAFAVQVLPGLKNCSQPFDASAIGWVFPSINGVYFDCDSITNKKVALTIANVGINPIDSVSVSYKIDNNPISSAMYLPLIASGSNVTFTFPNTIGLNLSSGLHTISAFVSVSGDNTKINDSIKTSFRIDGSKNVPFTEAFSGATFPPAGWQVIKSTTNSPGWEKSATIPQYSGTGTAAMFNNFNFNNRSGPEDELITAVINIPNTGTKLLFDRAYKIYPSYFDSLKIKIADDCGKTFNNTIYIRGYKSLATILDSSTTTYTPSASNDWNRDTIDLAPFAGKSIAIKFINKGDYGNRLFIDNINIQTNAALGISNNQREIEGITIYPNPSKGIYQIITNDNKAMKASVYDVNGRVIKLTTVISNGQLDLSDIDNGIYYLKINRDGKSVYKKLIKY
jgi:hypothetical protein